jgi:hypothetical protein
MIVSDNHDALDYYAQQSTVTDPGPYAGWLAGLPSEVCQLSEIIQGLLIHILEVQRYGVQLEPGRRAEVRVGLVHGILSGILSLDRSPLTLARPPERRWVATCHDFSVLLCAFLRSQGRPARPRAGWAAYLLEGKFIDHWVCEFWQPVERRWQRVDAQLDEVHRKGYRVAFDPCDLPRGQYLTGAEAWKLCRAGELDAQRFGFSRWWGWGYLRHSVLRDLLALNKVESLPWESAGLPEKGESGVTEEQRQQVDRLAALAAADDVELDAVRKAYEQLLQTGSPPDWRPWSLDDLSGIEP